MDRFLDLPDFPFWSAAVGRRIHDDRVIMVAAADLTLYEFDTVVHDPADRSVLETGGNRIFLCPGNHTLRSVYMCNACSCCSSGKGSATGVGEEVQHFDRASGFTDLVTEPVPVSCLFREKTGVLEAERL